MRVRTLRSFLSEGHYRYGIVNSDGTYILWRSLIMLALAIAGFGVTMITQYLGRGSPPTTPTTSKRKSIITSTRFLRVNSKPSARAKPLTLINNDSFSLQVGVNMFMRLLVRAPFLVIGSVISAFILVPVSRVHRLGALLLSSIVIFVVMALTPKKYQAIQEELDHISTLGEDDLTGARVVRAFNKEEAEQDPFPKSVLKLSKESICPRPD
jgi:ATP-binding cassette subfamily B protein